MMPKKIFAYIMLITITTKAKFSLRRLKMAKFIKMSLLDFFSSSELNVHEPK